MSTNLKSVEKRRLYQARRHLLSAAAILSRLGEAKYNPGDGLSQAVISIRVTREHLIRYVIARHGAVNLEAYK